MESLKNGFFLLTGKSFLGIKMTFFVLKVWIMIKNQIIHLL